MLGLVYHLFCTVTGKAYVGQTWETLEERWREHLRDHSHCLHLQRALQKYGPGAFVRAVLTQGLTTQEDMDAAEQYWIGYFDSIKNGYNIREGGSRGRHSEETKRRMSLAQRSILHLHKIGTHHSSVTRGRISAALTGKRYRPHTEEERRSRALVRGARPFVDQNGVRYEYPAQAARLLGLYRPNVSAVLRGVRRQTNGYTFRYVEEADGY